MEREGRKFYIDWYGKKLGDKMTAERHNDICRLMALVNDRPQLIRGSKVSNECQRTMRRHAAEWLSPESNLDDLAMEIRCTQGGEEDITWTELDNELKRITGADHSDDANWCEAKREWIDGWNSHSDGIEFFGDEGLTYPAKKFCREYAERNN